MLGAEYTTGAVYLAGYAVECILTALTLMSTPARSRPDMLKSFRGGKAHEFDWLRTLYLTNGGTRFPREITQHFTLVSDWSTDLRYMPRSVRANDAEEFFSSALKIIQWAGGRI